MKYVIVFAFTAIFVSQMPVRSQTAVDRLKEAASDVKHAVKDAAGVVEQKTRHAWRETKEYLSNDPDTYRPAATRQLDDLRATIADLKREASTAGTPAYFIARLEALALHQSTCSLQLAALTTEEIRDAHSVRRAEFDTTFSWLETYVDLAQREDRELAASVQR
jgi:hypothetical protein